MNNLTDDQQKVSDELEALIMQRVYSKVAHVLTNDDIEEIEKLDTEDISGNATRQFILSKVPNFDKLFDEELELFNKELGIQSQ